MPDEDFEAFLKSHELAVDIARAAICFLRGQLDFDGFHYEVRQVHTRHCVPDNISPPRPALRLVSGD
jgi:hypothetical protein